MYEGGPQGQKKHLKDVDFGVTFTTICNGLIQHKGEYGRKQVTFLQHRAWAFLLALVEETEKRLPANTDVFKQLRFFSPAVVFKRQFGEMPFLGCLKPDQLEELEEQFREFKLVEWKAASPFSHLEEIPVDPIVFWRGVLDFSHEDNNNQDDTVVDVEGDVSDTPFKKLAKFVLGRYTLAHSTAAVERIFSVVACVKSKQRNRMKTGTLESIIRIRSYLSVRNKCCRSMEVNDLMLSLFKLSMYKFPVAGVRKAARAAEEDPDDPGVPVESQAEEEESETDIDTIVQYMPPVAVNC